MNTGFVRRVKKPRLVRGKLNLKIGIRNSLVASETKSLERSIDDTRAIHAFIHGTNKGKLRLPIFAREEIKLTHRNYLTIENNMKIAVRNSRADRFRETIYGDISERRPVERNIDDLTVICHYVHLAKKDGYFLHMSDRFQDFQELPTSSDSSDESDARSKTRRKSRQSYRRSSKRHSGRRRSRSCRGSRSRSTKLGSKRSSRSSSLGSYSRSCRGRSLSRQRRHSIKREKTSQPRSPDRKSRSRDRSDSRHRYRKSSRSRSRHRRSSSHRRSRGRKSRSRERKSRSRDRKSRSRDRKSRSRERKSRSRDRKSRSRRSRSRSGGSHSRSRSRRSPSRQRKRSITPLRPGEYRPGHPDLALREKRNQDTGKKSATETKPTTDARFPMGLLPIPNMIEGFPPRMPMMPPAVYANYYRQHMMGNSVMPRMPVYNTPRPRFPSFHKVALRVSPVSTLSNSEQKSEKVDSQETVSSGNKQEKTSSTTRHDD